MATTKQTAFRLPETLLRRIENYGVRLRARHPGMTFTRTDTVALLLTQALDAEQEPATTRWDRVRKAKR